jgi:thiamine pyrophosphokinase
MRALILADGDVPQRELLDLAWPGWDDGVELVVAADGGARHAPHLGLALDLWVGDGDSLDSDGMAAIVAGDVPMERANPHKDESDAELAVRAAIGRGADGIVILGGLGGTRLDHALANIGLLAMPELRARDASLLDDRARVRLLSAPDRDGGPSTLSLAGRVGDMVSLLPAGAGVEGVTTSGLAYPMRNEPLPPGPARGLSNVREAADAWVTVANGLLLVVETPATLSE